MKPFLRATDRGRLAPVGWESEPAGEWAGRDVEVVFDPARHQIVMLRNAPSDPTRSVLAEQGFRRLAAEGHQEMWVRTMGASAEIGELVGEPDLHSAASTRPAIARAVCSEASGIALG